MKRSNTCMLLFRINKHYITSNINIRTILIIFVNTSMKQAHTEADIKNIVSIEVLTKMIRMVLISRLALQ